MSLFKNSVKSKKKKDGLQDRIEAYLEAKVNKPLPYKQKPGHKPSVLGTDCLRKIYYSYHRVQKDTKINAFLARIFDTGHYLEKMVLGWLIEMGEHIPYRDKSGNIPFNHDGTPNPQFPVIMADWRIPKGYIDNTAIVNNELWLYEIKSKKADKFDAMQGPDADHLTQVACYFKGFSDHLLAGDFDHIPELKGYTAVTGIKFIYVNKNNSNTKIFSLDPESLVDNIIEIDTKLTEVHDYVDKKVLPPPTKSACQYCEFKKKCKANYNLD